MAINYTSLAATALRLIDENGKNVVVRKVVPETPVDVNKPWRKGTPNSIAVTVKAVEHPYTQFEVDDKVITKGDTRLYVSASAFAAAAAEEDIAATNTLTLTGQPLDTETITVDGKVYTFQTVLTNANGNVLIGVDAETTLDNLVAAINLAAGSGTLYAAATTLHPTVSAADGTGLTVVLTAKTAGSAGNSLTASETVTGGSIAATFSGGFTADRDMEDYNFITFNSEKWRIVKASPIRPAEIVVLYDLHMRR